MFFLVISSKSENSKWFNSSRTYSVVLQLPGSIVELGLELKSEGLLEVDRPDGLIADDLGGADLALGNGEDDGLSKNGDEFLGNRVLRLGDPQLAPVFGGDVIVVGPLQPLVDFGVLRVLDGQDESVGLADLQVHGAVDGLKFWKKNVAAGSSVDSYIIFCYITFTENKN